MTPEFPFFSWPDNFPAEEDYTEKWPDHTVDVQPSTVHDPFLGGLVSVVSSGISKVTHAFLPQDVHGVDLSGNPSNGSAAFSDVEPTDAVVLASIPASKITWRTSSPTSMKSTK
jgi:hypothetical protein